MTRQEAEPIIVDLLKNLLENPNFAAPRKTFDAIDVFVAPKAEANGQGEVAAVPV